MTPERTDTHQVFISYSSKEAEAATSTCRALEENGIKCWMAPRDILPGASYGEAVLVAIEKSKFVVVLLSANSNDSRYVASELEHAKNSNVPIIAFRLENIEPSNKILFFLNTEQRLDAFPPPIEDHLTDLVRGIKAGLSIIETPRGGENVQKALARQNDQIESVFREIRRKRHLSPGAKIVIAIAALAFLVLTIIVVNRLTRHPFIPIKSFAILPLRDETGSTGQEYLGYGLSECISDRLSRLPFIKVVPSGALFGYDDSSRNYRRLGEAMGVDAVLEGKFYRQGDNLTVSAALIEAATGRVRWQNAYRQSLTGISAFVKNITRDIADTLDIPLHNDTASFVLAGCGESVAASEAYLKGQYYKRKGTSEDNALAIEYFKEALATDASCGPALVGLADAQEYHVEQGWSTDHSVLSQAEASCFKALAIDSGNAGAYAVLGAIAELNGKDAAALAFYDHAIKIDPANALVLTRMALLYFNKQNDRARAIKSLKFVQELQPFNADNMLNLGAILAMSRQHREALEAFRRVVELRPDLPDAWHNLGYLYERLGYPDSAMRSYASALTRDNSRGDTYLSYATLAMTTGRSALAESLLTTGRRILGDIRLTYALGGVYASSGRTKERDQMFQEGLAWLEVRAENGKASAGDYALLGMFQARLGLRKKAKTSVSKAERLAQPNEDVVYVDLARVFSILGEKNNMLACFSRAHEMRPLDYDEYFVRSTPDFESFRTDPKLLAIASQ